MILFSKNWRTASAQICPGSKKGWFSLGTTLCWEHQPHGVSLAAGSLPWHRCEHSASLVGFLVRIKSSPHWKTWAPRMDKGLAGNTPTVTGLRGRPVPTSQWYPRVPPKLPDWTQITFYMWPVGTWNVQGWTPFWAYVTSWALMCCWEHLCPLCPIVPTREQRSWNRSTF